jgi:hypothetical protein
VSNQRLHGRPAKGRANNYFAIAAEARRDGRPFPESEIEMTTDQEKKTSDIRTDPGKWLINLVEGIHELGSRFFQGL